QPGISSRPSAAVTESLRRSEVTTTRGTLPKRTPTGEAPRSQLATLCFVYVGFHTDFRPEPTSLLTRLTPWSGCHPLWKDIHELWTGSVPPSTPGRRWDRRLCASSRGRLPASPWRGWWVPASTLGRAPTTAAATRWGLWPTPATREHGDDDRRARGQHHRSVPVLGCLAGRHHLGDRGSGHGVEQPFVRQNLWVHRLGDVRDERDPAGALLHVLRELVVLDVVRPPRPVGRGGLAQPEVSHRSCNHFHHASYLSQKICLPLVLPGFGKVDVAGRDVATRAIPQQSVAVGDLVGQVVSAPAASGGRTRCGAVGAFHRTVLARGYFGDSSVDNHRTAALSPMGESFQRK